MGIVEDLPDPQSNLLVLARTSQTLDLGDENVVAA